MLAFIAVMLTSCLGNDVPEPVDARIVEIKYGYELKGDYANFYDLKRTYVDVDAQKEVEESNAPVKNELNRKIVYDKAPARYIFKLVATPKSPLPPIDSETVCKFECVYSGVVAVTNNGALTKLIMNQKNSQNYTLKGSDLASKLAKGPETLINMNGNKD